MYKLYNSALKLFEQLMILSINKSWRLTELFLSIRKWIIEKMKKQLDINV